jgi:hypothetical protein
MSKHPGDEDLLGLIDAEIPAAHAAAIEAHLEYCQACLARYHALRGTSNEVAALWNRAAQSPADVMASRTRVRGTMQADIERRWRRRSPVVLALTSALLFFVVRHESTELHRSLVIERGALPVRSFTPGFARAVSTDSLCSAALKVPPRIPSALRLQVLRDYGMEHVPPAEYELDYLITPELGGLTDRRNLWPEPYGLRSWNAHAKDELEHRLPHMVCSGEIDLATAQREIASNWIDAYKKYLPSERPAQLHARVLELPRFHPAIVD